MRNTFERETEPWLLMEEALDAIRAFDSSKDAMEEIIEKAIDEYDTVLQEKQDQDGELEALEDEIEKLKSKVDSFNPNETLAILNGTLAILKRLEIAAVAVVTFTNSVRKDLRENYGLAEESPNGSSGNSGDDYPEDSADEGSGETTS